MRVITFSPRFVELVRNGAKPHTIREKARCQPGDTLSLRYWIGKPRRPGCRQQLISEETCVAVLPIVIGCGVAPDWISLDGAELSAEQRETLARNDGFEDAADMLAWFKLTHGLPFEGFLIAWREVEL